MFAVMLLMIVHDCRAQETSETEVIIIVQVMHGTANGRSAVGDEVSVRVYEHEKLRETLKGTVDADYQAVFPGVVLGDHAVAVASVKHEDMMFAGRPAALRPSDHTMLPVHVYDVSNDQSQLSISSHHIIIEIVAGRLRVKEYVQLRNIGDMAVSANRLDHDDRPIVLEMKLPEGFMDLECLSYFDRGAIVSTRDGFYDTMATPPGEHSAAFAYSLEIDSPTVDISRGITLPTSSLVVFAQRDGMRLEGLGEQEGVVSPSGGKPLAYYVLKDRAKNDLVAFQLKGFNVSAAKMRPELILAVVFGCVLVLVLLRVLRSQKTAKDV